MATEVSTYGFNASLEYTTLPTSALSSFNPSGRSIAIFCIQLFLSVMTIIMNLLILRALHIDRRLRTYSNQYILNITISDLLVGFVMSIRCSIILFDDWIFGDVLAILFIGVQNIVLGVSVLGIIAICLDRYVATYHPIRHFQRKRKSVANIVNGITWIASMSFWIPISVIWDFVQPPVPKDVKDYFAPNYGDSIYSTVAIAILRLAFPFIIIATLYFKIYVRIKGSGSKHLSNRFELRPRKKSEEKPVATIKCERTGKNYTVDCEDHKFENDNAGHVKDIKDKDVQKNTLRKSPCKSPDKTVEQQNNGDSMRPVLHQELPIYAISRSSRPKKSCNSSRQDRLSSRDSNKSMRTLTFVTAAFFITWLPNSINVIYIYVVSNNVYFAEIARWVTYSNSLINPIAYGMAQPLFRKNILRILKCQR